MEKFTDLSIVIRSFPYQERDRIAVCLTQNHGKITGLAKGGIHSRRFAGSLDFLACSKISFTLKPHAELARLEYADVHHEFKNLHRDFSKLTAASFAAEFCLHLLEPQSPLHEMFAILSNLIFKLDEGMPAKYAINAFLCKAMKTMGYNPSLLRCVQCTKNVQDTLQEMYWSKEKGGMICGTCAEKKLKTRLDSSVVLYFHHLITTPFKNLETSTQNSDDLLYQILSDFLHHHVPGIPSSGFKSWKLLNETLESTQSPDLNLPQ